MGDNDGVRIIGHLDLDAFFASVEERDRPHLRGKPIVVGADPEAGRGRGVVSTASYAARKYGIHSAMPISEAWRLSEAARARGEEPAVFISSHFSKYSEVWQSVVSIVRRSVPVLQRTGVDEMYMDLSFTRSFAAAGEMCLEIKKEIFETEKITASVGIGPNRLIAKIASDFRKPDGLTLVAAEDAFDFLAPLAVRVLPGVGPKTEQALLWAGIKTVSDLRGVSEEELETRFGKWGRAFYLKARGIDDSPLTEEREVKSVGEQETFREDTRDAGVILGALNKMCEDVFRRLRAGDFKSFWTVVITVRFGDFTTKSRAHTLPEAADTLDQLKSEAIRMFLPFLDRRENPARKNIRLVGVRVEKLE